MKEPFSSTFAYMGMQSTFVLYLMHMMNTYIVPQLVTRREYLKKLSEFIMQINPLHL